MFVGWYASPSQSYPHILFSFRLGPLLRYTIGSRETLWSLSKKNSITAGTRTQLKSLLCEFHRVNHQTFASVAVSYALSRGFCCVQVNSVLKSLLSTFTHTQNAPAELRR